MPAKKETYLAKRTSPSLILETRDINVRSTHSFNRGVTVNPLDPVYKVCVLGNEGKTYAEIGEIAGSHPRKLPDIRKDSPMFSLRSDDIEGAKPCNAVPYPKNRRQWKNTCDISDISTKGKVRL